MSLSRDLFTAPSSLSLSAPHCMSHDGGLPGRRLSPPRALMSVMMVSGLSLSPSLRVTPSSSWPWPCSAPDTGPAHTWPWPWDWRHRDMSPASGELLGVPHTGLVTPLKMLSCSPQLAARNSQPPHSELWPSNISSRGETTETSNCCHLPK